MAEFKLPDLGDGIASGNVIGILAAVGDTVAANQDVIELETDKATVTVPTTVGGKITAVHVTVGDTVKVGQVVFTFEGASNSQAAPAPLTPNPSPSGRGAVGEGVAPQAAPPPSPSGRGAGGEGPATGPAEFKLPELGDNITGGDVIGVLVAIGDVIKEGQDILELETDKASVTVPSSVSGKVTAINVAVGQRAIIGQVILTVSGAAALTPNPSPSGRGAGGEGPAAVPLTPPPSLSGRGAGGEGAARASITEVPVSGAFMPNTARSTVPAAPNARRLARELGIEVANIPPSATGRVTLPGLKDYVRQRNQGLVAAPAPAAPTASAASAAAPAPVSGAVVKPLPNFSKWGEIEIEKMSGIRRATANQMAYSWSVAPRVTQFDKADIVEMEAIRKKYGSRVEKSGAKLTMTAMLLKIAAAALKQFPKFNASIDMENEQIILKKYFHIGVAVDTPHGLVVPVIRDVDRKSIFDLAIELNTVAGKARDRKLSMDEMQGGCFTISNLGGIGGTNFTPIVNAPEVAILGVSRGAIEPVYNGEAFEPRLMMPLSLSYDHRLIDGAQGARFLRWICNALENPMLMSLQAW